MNWVKYNQGVYDRLEKQEKMLEVIEKYIKGATRKELCLEYSSRLVSEAINQFLNALEEHIKSDSREAYIIEDLKSRNMFITLEYLNFIRPKIVSRVKREENKGKSV